MKIKDSWGGVLMVAIEELEEDSWWNKKSELLNRTPIDELKDLLKALSDECRKEVGN